MIKKTLNNLADIEREAHGYFTMESPDWTLQNHNLNPGSKDPLRDLLEEYVVIAFLMIITTLGILTQLSAVT